MSNIKIRTTITDDDIRVSTHIERLLLSEYQDIEILDKPTNVSSAVTSIKLHGANLIFLDIDLGGETSFEILDQIDRIDGLPEVIFVTAHESYAIRAIKNQAIDYILKPINREKLYDAVNRARKKIIDRYYVKSIKASSEYSRFSETKIQIPQTDGIEFIKLRNIVLFKAQRNYTEVYLKSGRTILCSKTLKHFTDTVPSQLFFRSHRSFLINLNEVRSIKTRDGGFLIMSNDEEATITRSKRKELSNVINDDYLKQ